jgi:hypothetical protein
MKMKTKMQRMGREKIYGKRVSGDKEFDELEVEWEGENAERKMKRR